MPTASVPDVEVLLVSPSNRRTRTMLYEFQDGQWQYENAFQGQRWPSRDEAIGAAEYKGWQVEIIT